MVVRERRAQQALVRKVLDAGVEALAEALAAYLLEVRVDGVSGRDRELRKRVLYLVELELAALGKLHGAAHDLRGMREDLLHLGRRLHVELVGVKLEPLGSVDRPGRLYAEQDFVRVVVVLAEIMRVVGGDKRDVELFFQAEKIGVNLLLELKALVLDFKEEVAAAEDVLVLACGAPRALVVVLHQVLRKLAGEAAGEADESRGVLGKVLLRDAGLAVEAVQRGFAGDADQVAVALLVFSKHEQGVIVVALRIGAVVLLLADVELAAENGLDALLLRGLKEMHGSIDVAVVGDGDRGLADVLHALDELVHIAGAVEEGKVSMEMEVGELGHAPSLLAEWGAAAAGMLRKTGPGPGNRGKLMPWHGRYPACRSKNISGRVIGRMWNLSTAS